MTVLRWVLVAFAVFYLLHDPSGAAAFVMGVMHALGTAGDKLSSFAQGL